MKKYFILLAFLFLIFSPNRVFAKNSDYKLPYPGIMPNNVLWPIKELRDKIVSLFIFDPVAKSYYYLLQADKRMAMTEPLITEAQQYFDKALEKEEEAYLKGQKTGELFAKLNFAIEKYQEIASDSGRLNKVKQILSDRLSKVKE